MVKVNVGEYRPQDAHYGLYQLATESGDIVIVRRKVGEPTDYLHPNSRKVRLQRRNFGLASTHYSHLTPIQKKEIRYNTEEVEYSRGSKKSGTKLLTGRTLFISKDIHTLNETQRQIPTPLQICILLSDPDLNPLEGDLWLYYLEDGEWKETTRKLLSPGYWLFPEVPSGKKLYHPIGQASDYLDPQDPDTTYLSQKELMLYHYHTLIPCQPILEYIGILGPAFACTEGWRAAQTFSFTTPVTLTGVTLMAFLFDPDHDGTLYINIEETTNGLPNGTIRTQGNARVTTLTWTSKQITILLSSATLEANKQYAVVASIIMDKPYPHTDSLRLSLLNATNPYPPQLGLRSFESSGLIWYTFPRNRCYYQILLGSTP